MNALARRLITSLMLLAIISMASFSLLKIMPGDFAEVLLMKQMDGDAPTEEALKKFKQENGFYDPMPVQYLRWMADLGQGDLGTSFQSGDSVTNELMLRLPNTLILALTSILISLLVAFPLGVLAALKPDSIYDRAAMTFAVVGMAMPNFWLALLGILFFSITLGWLPVSGYATWAHLVLPSLVIGTSMAGITARLVRATMLEVMSEDFIRTAYAQGMSRTRVVLTQALPNAMIPIITLVGLQMGKMFDNVVVVEAVFGWPGIGRLFIESTLGRDFPVMQGCILVIGITYIGINLAVDIIVSRLDPRIKGLV